MSNRAVDAAGIVDPTLREDYEQAHRLYRRSGQQRFLPAQLLPAGKRPHVWAVLAFGQRAFDVAHAMSTPDAQAMAQWGQSFLDSFAQDNPSHDRLARAMANTMRRWSIPRSHCEMYFEALQRDMGPTDYHTYADLEAHLAGGAALALQLLPILEPTNPGASARARSLGEAIFMSRTITQLSGDLADERIYFPTEDLDTFSVSPQRLLRRELTNPIRELVEFEIQRATMMLDFGQELAQYVHPSSRAAISLAVQALRDELEQVRVQQYQVLEHPPRVPWSQRMRTARVAKREAKDAHRDD